MDGAARGLFYGGGLHQLIAQVIAMAADFAVVFVLGYLALLAVKKTVGLRVKASDEVQGLDWAQVGALGYQPDVETFLVNRVGKLHEYYIVPIDECFRLVGLIRLHWRGLSGGAEVWKQIGDFFADLKARSTEVRETAEAEPQHA